jgi:formate dehydrogenase subunit delta
VNASQVDHLVKMANQIALNMGAWGDEDAVAQQVADHIRRFWTSDMQSQLVALHAKGAAELLPPVGLALDQLSQAGL